MTHFGKSESKKMFKGQNFWSFEGQNFDWVQMWAHKTFAEFGLNVYQNIFDWQHAQYISEKISLRSFRLYDVVQKH